MPCWRGKLDDSTCLGNMSCLFAVYYNVAGQAECVELFVKSIKSGEQLIPLEELFEISEVTISIAEDIRAQA